MATTPIARGRLSQMALAFQDDFTTPAEDGYLASYFYSHSLREAETPETDPLIGSAFNNSRDETPAAPGLSNHSGDIEVPLCLNGIGDWLKLVFGAPTTTGAGEDKTHVFASGTATLPSATAEFRAVAGDFRQHVGLTATQFRMTLADAAGYQRATISVIGRAENLLGASAAGVAVARALNQFPNSGSAVFMGGVQVGVLLGFDFTYTTGATGERYIDGDAQVAAAVLDEDATFTGNMRVRYTGPTFDTLAKNRTDSALEVRFVKSSTQQLVLALPAVRLGRAGATVSGPAGIEQSLPFRSGQTTAAAMVTATLKNQIVSYTA
jgi:hypothetical protein